MGWHTSTNTGALRVGFEITVNFHSEGKECKKIQVNLLKFFKLVGQSDPKRVKIISADQQCGDSSDAPVVSGNYDPH